MLPAVTSSTRSNPIAPYTAAEKAAHMQILEDNFEAIQKETRVFKTKEGKWCFDLAKLSPEARTLPLNRHGGTKATLGSFPSGPYNRAHKIGVPGTGQIRNPQHLQALIEHLDPERIATAEEGRAMIRASLEAKLDEIISKAGIFRTNEGKLCLGLAERSIRCGELDVTLPNKRTVQIDQFPSTTYNKAQNPPLGDSAGKIDSTNGFKALIRHWLPDKLASADDEKKVLRKVLEKHLEEIIAATGIFRTAAGKLCFSLAHVYKRLRPIELSLPNNTTVYASSFPSNSYNMAQVPPLGGNSGEISSAPKLKATFEHFAPDLVATADEEKAVFRTILEARMVEIKAATGIYQNAAGKLFFNRAQMTGDASALEFSRPNNESVHFCSYPGIVYNRNQNPPIGNLKGNIHNPKHLKDLFINLGFDVASPEEEFLEELKRENPTSKRFQSDPIEDAVAAHLVTVKFRLEASVRAVLRVQEYLESKGMLGVQIAKLKREGGYDLSYTDPNTNKRIYIDVISDTSNVRQYKVSAGKINKIKELEGNPRAEYRFAIVRPSSGIITVPAVGLTFVKLQASYLPKANAEIETRSLGLSETAKSALGKIYAKIDTILEREKFGIDKDSEVNWQELFKDLSNARDLFPHGINDDDKQLIATLLQLPEKLHEIKDPSARSQAQKLIEHLGLTELDLSENLAQAIPGILEKWLVQSETPNLDTYLINESIAHLDYSDLLRLEEYKIRLAKQAQEDLERSGQAQGVLVRATLHDREEIVLSEAERSKHTKVCKVFATVGDDGKAELKAKVINVADLEEIRHILYSFKLVA